MKMFPKAKKKKKKILSSSTTYIIALDLITYPLRDQVLKYWLLIHMDENCFLNSECL